MIEIPEWANKRADELADEFEGEYKKLSPAENCYAACFSAFAKYIAEHENLPVDQDVLDVREILIAWGCAREVIESRYSTDVDFSMALATYREIMARRNA